MAALIISKIDQQIQDSDKFLMLPVSPRLKEDSSILEKAFFRAKKYEDPYNDITDKIGIRFVVLELSDIEIIKPFIEEDDDLSNSKDVDFEQNVNNNPELFTYQSVHYIVRNRNQINYKGVEIPANTPCEVQIRTLLQHAYAELSHQTVYKSIWEMKPTYLRKLARSMALIEATDEIFKEVRQEMIKHNEKFFKFITVGKSFGEFPKYVEALNASIFDAYSSLISENDIRPESIRDFVTGKPYIKSKVSDNVYSSILFEQPVIYLLYYLASLYSSSMKDAWPYDTKYIEPIYSDLGINIER